MFKILIIDPDQSYLKDLSSILIDEGFKVFTTVNPAEAITIAKKQLPDLILLELIFPDSDGMDLCIELCKHRDLSKCIVAFYTSRDDDYSQVAAFTAGADDYIIKPKKARVLASRLRGLLRRHKAHEEVMLRGVEKGIVADRERYVIIKDGEELMLPRKEFEVIALLIEVPGKVYSRNQISKRIWGTELEKSSRTVDVHIRKIRERIGDGYIKTIKGVGYSMSNKLE
jgi:two-component system alkaline phosphatase synthesis response regulator PhoP